MRKISKELLLIVLCLIIIMLCCAVIITDFSPELKKYSFQLIFNTFGIIPQLVYNSIFAINSKVDFCQQKQPGHPQAVSQSGLSHDVCLFYF